MVPKEAFGQNTDILTFEDKYSLLCRAHIEPFFMALLCKGMSNSLRSLY